MFSAPPRGSMAGPINMPFFGPRPGDSFMAPRRPVFGPTPMPFFPRPGDSFSRPPRFGLPDIGSLVNEDWLSGAFRRR